MTEDGVLSLLSEAGHNKRRVSSFFLSIYLVLLPISTALTGIIGNTSIQNYIALIYLFSSFMEFLFQGIRIQKKMHSVFIFFLYTLVSIIWCKNATFNWYFFQFALSATIVISATCKKYSEKEYKMFEKAIYASFFLVVLLSIINYRSALDGRLTITIGSTMDPNDFACGMSIIISLCLYRIKLEKDIRFNYLVLVLTLGVIILSGSRGALMMVLVMGLVWLLMTNRSKRIKTIITLITIIVLAILFIADNLPTFLSDRFQISNVISSGGTGRIQIWSAALDKHISSDVIRKIVGYGHGGFREAVHFIAPGHSELYESHNMFINALIEGGIIGLLLLVVCLCHLLRYSKKRKNIFGLLAIIGLIVEGISLDVQSYRVFAIAFIFAIIWKEKDVSTIYNNSKK